MEPLSGPSMPEAAKIYAELCTGIRETDSISFRLLNLVPLVTGTALAALVIREKPLPPELVTLFALFAAAITVGLFRWELWNVQKCHWLVKYAEGIEKRALLQDGLFLERPPDPQRVGKAEAEKLIYFVTIIVWLATPLALGAVKLQAQATGLSCLYLWATVVISIVAAVSVFAKTEVSTCATSKPGA